MEKLYIDCSEENKKILKNLGFKISYVLSECSWGYIVIYMKEKYCYRNSIRNYTNYYTTEQFTEKYRGKIGINNLNLL